MALLFVTWDGPSTNYLEGLFFPVFSGLEKEIHVLQFSSAPASHIDRIKRVATSMGIGYHPVSVRRSGGALGTAIGTFPGAVKKLVRLAHEVQADLVMPRSTIPAALVLAARPMLNEVRVAFEADGLMADERVDFSGWSPNGLRYLGAREVESRLVRTADVVLTRTARAKAILLARAGAGQDPAKVHVVPNGKDEHIFRPRNACDRMSVRRDLGVGEETPLFIYVGSIGPQYLPEQMFRIFGHAFQHDPSSRMLVLTGSSDLAHEARSAAGVVPSSIDIRRVSAEEVPRLLSAADVGFSLRKATFSQQAVCPIKVAEYLLSGLPTITNVGVGDLDTQLADNISVLLLDQDDPATLKRASVWSSACVGNENRREAARRVGMRHFSLSQAVAGYKEALRYAG